MLDQIIVPSIKIGVWLAPLLMLAMAIAMVFVLAKHAKFPSSPKSAVIATWWRRLAISSHLALCGLLVLLASYALYAVNAGWTPWFTPNFNANAAANTLDSDWIAVTPFGLVLALLVQFLGSVIIAFSSRYLASEPHQLRYMAAMATVLAAVQLLLMANHWVILIVVWSAIGFALQHLLCFYEERPFAQLAAHKKRIADVLADLLLILAAVLAWREVGSGSLHVLFETITRDGMNTALQASAVLLVLAVVLRTASLPFHGWLIQVMEAPTPVSALLHAGVVNLGGFVLIRFASLLDQALWARSVLLAFGLSTAILAGMVMLTRVSIKLRLAWSTVAQMGFMLVECAAGLYSIAALHILGHSLYKAHAFLSSSNVVYETRLAQMRGTVRSATWSLMLAPCLSLTLVFVVQFGAEYLGAPSWAWWWNAILGFALAPLLWTASGNTFMRLMHGAGMVLSVAVLAVLLHYLPLGLLDAPSDVLGVIAFFGMALFYLILALIEAQAPLLETWRRWSYAGFYIDEWYTRLSLRIWPTTWVQAQTCPFHDLKEDQRKNEQAQKNSLQAHSAP